MWEWSGCIGIGLERWVSAFYAQKGLDADGWPDAFREIVGELHEGIRFLKGGGVNPQKHCTGLVTFSMRYTVL